MRPGNQSPPKSQLHCLPSHHYNHHNHHHHNHHHHHNITVCQKLLRIVISTKAEVPLCQSHHKLLIIPLQISVVLPICSTSYHLQRCFSLLQGWAGKAFWLPGTGREIENHIPVLREGNGNSQIATGREGKGNLRLVIPGIPGNPGNHIKSKIKFKIIFMPWQAIRSQSFFNQCKDDICNRFTQL